MIFSKKIGYNFLKMKAVSDFVPPPGIEPGSKV